MIPIYRAKKKGSREYVIGQFCSYKGYPTIFDEYGLNGKEIDITTLAIHFPDMLDSQGNKIFASLQENGKGGDIVNYKSRTYTVGVSKNYPQITLLKFKGFKLTYQDFKKVKIIGIQE
ncbi:hypothetical protein ACOTVP_08785 [Aliarcobacter butzleri]